MLFDPDGDTSLCKVDPLDPDPTRQRKHYEALDNEADVLVLWRERGEQFEGGYLDHVISQGVFENVTMDQVNRAIANLEEL